MNNHNSITIAIDPGTNGAAAISGYTSHGDTIVMGIEKAQEWANTIQKEWGRPIVVFIEKVQLWGSDEPGKAMMMQRLFRQQSELTGYFKGLGCDVVEVHPRTWQKHYPTDKRLSKTARKAALRDIAKGLYEFNKATLINCDALLILHYANNFYK